jgi:hypothetical protein
MHTPLIRDNTDQTGCEHRVNIRRTLTHNGEETIEVLVRETNKIIHSRTPQHATTVSGLFANNGRRMRSSHCADVIWNVYVTATKSEKNCCTRNTNSFWTICVRRKTLSANLGSWGQTDDDEFLSSPLVYCNTAEMQHHSINPVMCIFTDK